LEDEIETTLRVPFSGKTYRLTNLTIQPELIRVAELALSVALGQKKETGRHLRLPVPIRFAFEVQDRTKEGVRY
jgi:hypothetical protein